MEFLLYSKLTANDKMVYDSVQNHSGDGRSVGSRYSPDTYMSDYFGVLLYLYLTKINT